MGNKKKIIIVGAGGHAKVVAECVDQEQYEIVGFLDKNDDHIGEFISGIPVIGNDRDGIVYKNQGIYGCLIAVGHVGNALVRNRLYTEYKKMGFRMINAVHKESYISRYALLGDGITVMPNAVINSGAQIGNNVIVNTGAIVEHDVILENGVHVAPRSVVSGGAIIGENTLIGVGAVVIQGIMVGSGAVVGAGAVVIKDVPAGMVVVGNPAKELRRG